MSPQILLYLYLAGFLTLAVEDLLGQKVHKILIIFLCSLALTHAWTSYCHITKEYMYLVDINQSFYLQFLLILFRKLSIFTIPFWILFILGKGRWITIADTLFISSVCLVFPLRQILGMYTISILLIGLYYLVKKEKQVPYIFIMFLSYSLQVLAESFLSKI